MMMKRKITRTALGFALLLSTIACTDSRYLDAVPDKALVIPSTLNDYQAILDRDQFMNGYLQEGVTPALGEAGADDYTFIESWADIILDNEDRNVYTWNDYIFERDGNSDDWTFGYRTIFYANMVLDGLPKVHVDAHGTETRDGIRGAALFYRAHASYQLAQVFAPPYPMNGNAATIDGIPLRLTSDVNEAISRANLEETYQQILSDLKEALPLLPVAPPFNTRPSSPAAYALLARVYQTMHMHDQALRYADSCLHLKRDLLDYNDIPAYPEQEYYYPFGDYRDNPEIIFFSSMVFSSAVLIRQGLCSVQGALYESYRDGDLRRTLFFKERDWGAEYFGSYTGYATYFTGLAVDEVYLIRAESLARMGEAGAAIQTLNELLETRWSNDGRFVPLVSDDKDETLQWIIEERRKQLLTRGLRWTDLRRLNEEGGGLALSRTLNGTTYHLPPKDPRYTYPIPPVVTNFNPAISQNVR